jgi:hypothetical protein
MHGVRTARDCDVDSRVKRRLTFVDNRMEFGRIVITEKDIVMHQLRKVSLDTEEEHDTAVRWFKASESFCFRSTVSRSCS